MPTQSVQSILVIKYNWIKIKDFLSEHFTENNGIKWFYPILVSSYKVSTSTYTYNALQYV